MKLEIMYTDKHVETIQVRFISNLSTVLTNEPLLYFERYDDTQGKGRRVRLAETLCWQIIER